jgi:hypothetical protein
MATVIDTTFIGFRQVKIKYNGANCSVCGHGFWVDSLAMYNALTREFRCLSCNVAHPANVDEIWEADVTDQNEDTGEWFTERRVIRIKTRIRTTNPPRNVTLIRMIDTVAPGTTPAELKMRFGHIAPVRGHFS